LLEALEKGLAVSAEAKSAIDHYCRFASQMFAENIKAALQKHRLVDFRD
jgi:hypothetical protein